MVFYTSFEDKKASSNSEIDNIVADEHVETEKKVEHHNTLNFLQGKNKGKVIDISQTNINNNENESLSNSHNNVCFKEIIEFEVKSEELINRESLKKNKINIQEKTVKFAEYFDNPRIEVENEGVINEGVPRRLNFDGL